MYGSYIINYGSRESLWKALNGEQMRSPIAGKENHVLSMNTTLKDLSYMFSTVAQVFRIERKNEWY